MGKPVPEANRTFRPEIENSELEPIVILENSEEIQDYHQIHQIYSLS